MTILKKLYLFILIFLISCTQSGKTVHRENSDTDLIEDTASSVSNKGLREGSEISTRYIVPDGFHREETKEGSFGAFLQNLPLKPIGYKTHLFNGQEKDPQISTSVIDFDIDSTNIQKAAASITRLRAEYLYSKGQFDKINFKLTNGFSFNFTKWAQGFRVKENESHKDWYKVYEKEDYSYQNFRSFLKKVFESSDDSILFNLLTPITKSQLSVGSVILQRGEKGHAVIIVDMIIPDNPTDSFKGRGVLLAQGQSPAQEIEIIEGYYDELGLFSKTQNPKLTNRFWSPTRHKAADNKFFTSGFSFEKPEYYKFNF
ncbi:MAG: DUF4846 domain-containing protein [Muribaculaceae bacterium]|nr:DUF4846 domain-containing protein [Muribaculaceae bacterium]